MKIIENGLIPIFEGENKQELVDARQLHERLEVGKDFSTWVKDRIDQAGLFENEDYVVFTNSGENPQGGRPSKEYALIVGAAKHIAMMERNEKGKEIRQYFIDYENKHRSRPEVDLITQFVLPQFRTWAKRFPDQFFKEIYRLNNWVWGAYGNTHPSCCGGMINKWVYGLLPEGIEEHLAALERDSNGWLVQKKHQWLNDEGVKLLEMHLYRLMGLMGAAQTWEQFEIMAERSFNKRLDPIQMKLIALV